MRDNEIDMAVVMAGDGQMNPDDLPHLLDPVASGEADYSKGNRLVWNDAYQRIPRVRYIGNAIQVFFFFFLSTDKVAVDFPIGHRQRRDEGIPVLMKKFESSVSGKLQQGQWQALREASTDRNKLQAMPVDDFMALLVA